MKPADLAKRRYQEAMESGSPYDSVIIDLTLPGEMGGKEVVKALHKLDPKANILVSSGYFNDPILTDFRRYGIKGVLAKPYQLEEGRVVSNPSFFIYLCLKGSRAFLFNCHCER